MEKFTHLEIGLENCDTITVERENVRHVYADRIHQNLYCNNYEGRLMSSEIAEHLTLVLEGNADSPHSPFGFIKPNNSTFDRLFEIPDICFVAFVNDETGERRSITVGWSDDPEDSDDVNKFETVTRNSDGSLTIVIDKKYE